MNSSWKKAVTCSEGKKKWILTFTAINNSVNVWRIWKEATGMPAVQTQTQNLRCEGQVR